MTFRAAATVWLTLAVWMLNVAASALAQPPQSSGHLLITGSTTMAPLVEAIARQFERMHPGVKIEVQSGGSARGLDDTRQGKAGIGMVSRALRESETDVHGLPFARDGIAVVVHKSNPVSVLTNSQVVDIYMGKLTNWKQVGGRDAPIVALGTEPGRSATELFEQYFGVAGRDMKVQRRLGENAVRIRAVAENRDAIHYISVGEAERQAHAGVPIKLLPAAGVPANSRSIRKGDFPISRPLTLVTRAQPQGLAKAFIDYCLSPEVTQTIVAHEFVPYLD